MTDRSHIGVRRSRDGRAAHLLLNRPEKLNAINRETLAELRSAIESIATDKSARVLTIRGAGGNFSAGADLGVFSDVIPDGDRDQAASFLTDFHEVLSRIERMEIPVMGVVEGYALAGGLELLLTSDLAIASEDAVIGDQHANFGLLGGGGNTQRLPRRIGATRAKELILTGKHLDATTAAEMGIVTRTAPPEGFADAVEDYVDDLAEKGRDTLTAAKRLIDLGQTMDQETGLVLEKQAALEHIFSEDSREGLAAFNENREPNF